MTTGLIESLHEIKHIMAYYIRLFVWKGGRMTDFKPETVEEQEAAAFPNWVIVYILV